MYDISVIIPTYNRSKLLDLTLQSLEKQNISAISFEVIVADDGSSDDTRDIIEKHKSTLKCLRYFYQEDEGYRVAAARNIGIKEANGELIIFLDCGVIAVEDFIYQHYNSHQNSKSCVVIGNVYGLYVKLDDPLFFKLLDFENIRGSIDRLGKYQNFIDVRYNFYKDFDFKLENMAAPWIYMWTCNMSVMKSELIKVGLFDETYKSWGMEDIDIAFRLYQENLPFVINLDALAIHYPHDSHTNFSSKNDSDFDNCEYFSKKFNCFESEMYYCGKGVFYNEDVRALFGHEKDRYDFNYLKEKNIFRFLRNTNLLIFGGFNGSILNILKEACLLEYYKPNYNNIKSKFPDCKIQHLIGASTSFSDKQFEAVLITDFWSFLEKRWLKNILKEALRIGESIYILFEIRYNEQIELKTENGKLNIFLSALNELGSKAKVIEERDEHTRLRLFRIQ